MKYLNKYELFTEASRKEIIASKDGSRFWNWNGKKVKFLTTNPKNDRVAVVMEVDEKGKLKGNKLFAKWEELKDWKAEVKQDTTEQPKKGEVPQLNDDDKKKIEKTFEEILNRKQDAWSVANSHFLKVSAMGGSGSLRELQDALEPIIKKGKLKDFKDSIIKLLTIDAQLYKLVNIKDRGKNATKENPYGDDEFAKAVERNREFVNQKLEEFDKEIEKLKTGKTDNSKNDQSTDNKEEASKEEVKAGSENKESNPAVDKRYKELLTTWKENQKKLGKNETPGQGTRARLMKQAQSELNFDETKDIEVDLKKLKKTTAYDAVDRLSSLVKGQKVSKPENVLKYLDFIKSKVNSGNVAKPSLN